MAIKWLTLDDRTAKTLEEVERAAQQAQVTLAAAHEAIANANRTLERIDQVVAKLAAVLK